MEEDGLTSPRHRSSRLHTDKENTNDIDVKDAIDPLGKKAKVTQEDPYQHNSVIRSYFMNEDGQIIHGRSYFCLNLCGLTGLLVVFVGFICGLVIVPGKTANDIYNGFVLTKSTDCYKNGTSVPQVCAGELTYEYFFWNITNPRDYVNGTSPPILHEIGPYTFSVKQHHYNVHFSSGMKTVKLDTAQFFKFEPAKSCPTCTLGDRVISANAVYQGVLQSQQLPEHQGGKPETALGTLAVGPILSGVVASAAMLIDPAQADPEGSKSMAILQWARGQIFGGYCVPGGPPPVAPEAYLMYSVWATCIASQPPSVVFPDEPQAFILFDFLENHPGSAHAIWSRPPGQPIAALDNFPEIHLVLLSGYIEFLSRTLAVPGIQATLGDFLDPENGGGILVHRSVGDRLFGWQDPLLTSLIGNVTEATQRIVFGFLPGFNDTSPNFGFGAHPFVNSILLSTGYGEVASSSRNLTQVMEYNGRKAWSAKLVNEYYRPESTALSDESHAMAESWEGMVENLTVAVGGSNGGLHGLNVKKDEVLVTFDHESFRPTEWSLAEEVEKQGLQIYVYKLAESELAPCPSCPFPEHLYGVQNRSFISGVESISSRGHFYQADPAIIKTWGNALNVFSPEPSKHESRMEVEPNLGLTISVQRTYQFNIKLGPTDVLYPQLWTTASNGTEYASSNESYDHVWVPDFWLKVTAEASRQDVRDIKGLVNLERNLQGLCLVVLPLVGLLLLAFALWNLRFKPSARALQAELRKLRMSRAKQLAT
mmetsp:Transcript_6842/g.41731  ORF Transcript_6842/g.41731 Transcript_6842/m.41731 type:complete len:764 (-) Transcript_6842:1055-3346(-)